MKNNSNINIKQWLQKSIELKNVKIDEASSALIQAVQIYGFKIRKNETVGDTIKIEAIFGSQLIASFLGLIPFCHHLPSGKRLMLIASFVGFNDPRLNIEIIPYMVLLDEEEIGGVTQTMPERASDEFFGARRMFLILNQMHKILGVQPSSEIEKFDYHKFVKDTVMGILIYPLESYRSPQIIHKPTRPGPAWCWGGFILPEVWFLWNNIWGVSLLACIPSGFYLNATKFGLSQNVQYGLLLLIVIIRLFLGKYGNKLFYAMHCRWPNET